MPRLPAPDHLLADTAWLRALTRRLVGDQHADDLEQEVVLASLQRPDPANRSWLAAVARNLAATLVRRRSSERRRLSRLPRGQHAPSAAELVATAELQQKAVAAVLALPTAYRDTVLLRFLQGLSLRATAEAMAVPEETVRTRQKRALAMLRTALAPDDRRRHGMALAGVVAAWSNAMNVKHLVAAAAVALFALMATSALWLELGADDPTPAAPSAVATDGALVTDRPDVNAARADQEVADRARADVTPPASAATTGSLRVRVRWHDTNEPAADAAVLFGPADVPGRFERTDHRGELAFASLDPDTYRVKLHDWQSESVAIAPGEARELELELQRGHAAHGVVLDDDQRPVAGAQILLSAGGTQPQWSFPIARSDRNGRFRVAGLRTYALVGARHPGLGTSDYRFIQGAPKAGPSHALTLRLPGASATLRGRVVDQGGAPIAGAWIMVGSYTGRMNRDDEGNLSQAPPAQRLATDDDGRFVATELRGGDCNLNVYHRGFGPHREVVELEHGEARDVQVVLRAGGELFGTVTTATGAPIAGASIEVDRCEYPERWGVETDAAGRFRYPDLEPGARAFNVSAEGYLAVKQTLELVSGERRPWHIVLDDTDRILGRLVDPNGAPLADHWVAATRERRGAKTDADGRFTLAVEQRTSTLLVRATAGFAPVSARFEGVEFGPSEQRFVLGPEHRPSAHVRGRVLDAGGAPLAGAQLELEQEGWPVRITDEPPRSAADGTFVLGPLPPGRYRVLPIDERDVFLPVDVVLRPDATHDMGAQRGARPARLAVVLTGTAAQRTHTRVELVDGDRIVRARLDDGAHRFDRVFPGDYELVVRVGDRELHRTRVALAPGDDAQRTFDLYGR